jgi:uncharacterized protein (TIGR03437 family)
MHKPRLCGTTLIIGLIAAGPSWCQTRDDLKKNALPNFDIREMEARGEPAVSQQSQARMLVERRSAALETFLASPEGARAGVRITPNRYGLPKLMVREGGVLSAPSTQEPEEIAKNFLRSHASLFPLSPPEVDQLRLLVKDATGGPTFLAFSETLDGIDVFDGQIKFTLSRTGEVVQVAAADVVPQLNLPTAPGLDAQAAVKAALTAIGAAAPAALERIADPNGKAAFRNPRGDRYSPITAELFIFPVTASSARLAYRVYLEADEAALYEILIDAQDGSLLYCHNRYLSEARGLVWPISPMEGTRQETTFRTTAVVRTDPTDPGPWLSATGTVTTGNNVDAYLDANGNDSPDATTDPNTQSGRAYSAGQTFDFPFGDGTTGQNPRLFQPAAVTNLFYFVNMAHDYYYSLGFTEVAGNLQTDNYGRGGLGNDAVRAEAEYGGFTDNSDFGPTPDGTAPIMRIGLYTRGTTSLTDDLDNDYNGQTVFHEYGHGVSNRLVGARTSTSCLDGAQSGAMGEGWSDYFAISNFNRPVYGAYPSQDPVKGLRRHSYEGYPYYYEDLGNGTYGYEVHDDGEVWAATLWELRKSVGQTVADQLVMDGLKSTPCSPSMTNARDAILSADQARYSGSHRTFIWQAFAAHGLGYSAYGADGDYTAGFRYDAAYDLPPDLQAASNPAITSNPLTVSTGMGDSYSYTVTASNPSGGTLNYALTTGPAGMTVDSASGVVSWVASFVGQRVKITVTDGRGGKVVHGYLLPVNTTLRDGTSVTISGPEDDTGFLMGNATFTAPAGSTVLQVTLRGGSGDADLFVFDPSGNGAASFRIGNSETLTFPIPAAGVWQIIVDGYLAYSGVSLTAALNTAAPLGANASLTGLSGVIGSETLYRVTVPTGALTFKVSTSGGTGDVDLYLRRGQPANCAPSSYVVATCHYDYRSYSIGNSESISISSPTAGDWYIDLSAYAAYSGVTLTTTTTLPLPLAVATTSPLPSGYVGGAYSQTLSATGGVSPYTWSVTSGSLPGGLTLSSGGTISGTPTAAGSFSFTVQVKDSAAATATMTFALTITATAPPLIATSSPLPVASVGVAYSQTLTATGGSTPYTWSVTSGALPGGLTLSAGGTISGTPTTAGTYSFTVQVRDSASATATKAFTLAVVAAGSSIITTVAGTGSTGFSGDGGPATSARLYWPYGVTVDGSGNIYIADWSNNRVRKVSPSGIISTVAGTGTAGYAGDGGPATSANLNSPYGTAVDGSGNLFIADENNNRIRKVSPSGIITTVAGTGSSSFSGDGGPATSAQLNSPHNVTLDGSGNLYFSDSSNNRIRKVSSTGIISTVAGNGGSSSSGDGGPATSAQLNWPHGVALDGSGNLYIGDYDNNRIRKVSSSGIITTVAGTGTGGFSGDGGPATSAQLYNPNGVVLDGSGNLYFSDFSNNRIRKVSPSGIITTVAGTGSSGFSGDGGPATSAQLSEPSGLAMDGSGNLFIADENNCRIRLIQTIGAAALSITTTSPLPQGTAGTAYSQTLSATGGVSPYTWSVTSGSLPGGLTLASSGAISGTPATAGAYSFTVQAKDSATATATMTFALTIATAPPAIATSSALPQAFVGVAYSETLTAAAGSAPYTWSVTSGSLPGGLTLSAGGTISGTPTTSGSFSFTVQVRDSAAATATKALTLAVVAGGPSIITTVAGTGSYSFSGDGGPATSAQLYNPYGVAVDGSGNIYIGDCLNNRVRKVSSSGIITTVAGTGSPGFSGDGGPATSAQLYNPYGMVVDGSGNLYIADSSNNRIRKISSTGIISTVAGNGGAGYAGDGGPATSAQLYNPLGVAVDGSGNIYIGDSTNNRVRKVSSSGIITTVAGTGSAGFSGDSGPATGAQLYNPCGVAVDGSGNLYIVDGSNQRIRKVSSNGIITTVAGTGSAGFSGDGGPATGAKLSFPSGVAVDGSGNIYIGDSTNNRVRKVSPSGIITTVAGTGSPGFSGDGGPATSAQLFWPDGVVVDGSGNIYIADEGNDRIRLVQTAKIPQIGSGGIVNNASYNLGSSAVAPGEIAAIFGTSLTDGTSCLPPSCNPVLGSNGRLNITMAGAQVTVNGIPAPIFYAAPTQLGIQIPFEVTGTSATAVVSVAGQASAPATVAVAPASPGIFTATSDGRGAGAFTHVNGSAVTTQNPAQRGELVILYATGLGQVAPAVPTGALPAGASSTVSPVVLTIGGIVFIPDFAGQAGCCVGLNQINARIPNGVSPGNAVPVVLSVGVQSSNTVTIAVQ